jgi:glycosyltransferase involved in cell wall biosynthesis
MKKKKIIASIIVANYNNEVFLKDCLKSLINQKFNSYEIIVVDDMSTDNSIKILDQFKNKIFLVKNKKKSKHGSYNQINTYYKGFLKSKGKYIFFLDSDDMYKMNKLKNHVSIFEKNKKEKIIFDLPILKFKNKSIKQNLKQNFFFTSSWPRFSPQSCISVRRRYAIELFTNLNIKRFDKIWFDFRIASYTFLKFKKIFILKDYLTYYRQHKSSVSQEFKTFNKNWWLRRGQAHNFIKYLSNKKKFKKKISLDKIITQFINYLIYD